MHEKKYVRVRNMSQRCGWFRVCRLSRCGVAEIGVALAANNLATVVVEPLQVLRGCRRLGAVAEQLACRQVSRSGASRRDTSHLGAWTAALALTSLTTHISRPR
jgi:hypothetical protein